MKMTEVINKRRATISLNNHVARKEYFATLAGWKAFRRERAAMQEFRAFSWMPPWIRWGISLRGRPWFETERYRADQRLDAVCGRLSDAQKREVAQKVLSITLDLYAFGWAHRDFHARNLFLLDDGRVMLKDYETMVQYGLPKPRFLEAYDMTGEGLDSPYKTKNMGFFKQKISNTPIALGLALGVTEKDVPILLAEVLREEVREASLTFQKDGRRHACRASRPYNSYQLTYLRIERHEAQRDSQKRFEKFGISRNDIEGKSVLDLGCHAGGMIFALQRFHPASSCGFEYDADKVRVARRIAALEDLRTTEFHCANVDRLSLDDIGGQKEIVLCLAIERHVQSPQHLYRLLGQACGKMLLFEGNAGSDPAEIMKNLKANGFRQVEYRGFCDDDILPENNVRPVWVAWK